MTATAHQAKVGQRYPWTLLLGFVLTMLLPTLFCVADQAATQLKPENSKGGPTDKKTILLTINEELTAKDPMRHDAYYKVHSVKLQTGLLYKIDLLGVNGLDTYLRVEDSAGKVLAEDDDSGGNLNARILFSPTQTATYNIVATTFKKGATGKYVLLVAVTDARQEKQLESTRLWQEAEAAYQDGRSADALTLMEKTLALDRELHGDSHPDVLACLGRLGQWRAADGDFGPARKAFQEILDIHLKRYGEMHWQVKDARLNLVYVERLTKMTAEERRSLGEADRLNSRVMALGNKGKFQEALPLAREALAITKKLLGEEQPRYLDNLNNLGWILRELKEFKEAEPLLRRNVELRQKLFGPDHPSTANGLNVLGWLRVYRSQWREAEDCFRRAEKILRHALPANDNRIAEVVENLWRLTDARLAAATTERVSKLNAQQRQRLDKAKQVLAETDVLNSTKNVAAIRTMREAVQELRELLGADDPRYLQSQLSLAIAYGYRGDDDRAAPIFRDVLKVQTKLYGELHPKIVATLEAMAKYHSRLGDADEAKRLEAKMASISGQLRIYKTLPVTKIVTRRLDLEQYSSDELRNLSKLGRLSFDQGDYAQAEHCLRGVVERCKKLRGEKNAEYATALEDLASLYSELGDYSRAEPMYLQVRDLRRTIFGVKDRKYGASLHNLALLYARLGHYAKAEPLLQEDLKIQQAAPESNPVDHAHTLVTLAYVYWRSGALDKAEARYQAALDLLKGKDDHALFATALDNLGFLCKDLRDFKRAEALLKQALDLRGKHLGKNHPDYADSLHDLAVLYDAMAMPDRAEPLIRDALAITRSNIEVARVVQSQRQQLAMAASMRSYLDTYLSLALRAGWSADQVYQEVLNWKGAVFASRRRGLETFTVAVQPAGFLGVGSQAATPPGPKGARVTEVVQGSAADRAGLKVGDIIVAVNESPVATPNEMINLLSDFKSGDKVQIRFRRDGADKVVPVVLAHREGAVTQSLPGEMENVLRELEHTVGSLTSYAFMGGEDLDFSFWKLKTREERLEAWKRQIDELTQKRERLEVELFQLTTKFQAGQSRKPVTPAQVRGALPPGSVLIDFLEFQNSPKDDGKPQPRLAAFVVRPGGPTALVDIGPLQLISELIGQRQALLKRIKGKPDQPHPAAELRRLLWAPLEGHVKDAKLVLLSPDGVLGQLPFAALPGKDKEKYLIEEVPLAVVPLPQLLPELLGKQGTGKEAAPALLLVGDVAFGEVAKPAQKGTIDTMRRFGPLPETRGEILAIRDSFEQRFPDGNVLLLRAGRATKYGVLGELSHYRWVHLATHGFFADPTKSSLDLVQNLPAKAAKREQLVSRQDVGWFHPWLLSGLALAGVNQPAKDEANGGILTALEVAEMNLPGLELVMLSACETGLGEAAKGEGIQSLQQAFQIAGARSVVGSLWMVDDRYTRVLMERFYENLWRPQGKAMSKLEALRQAQLWMLHEGHKRGLVPLDEDGADQRVSPYYWAAFVLSGDWR